MPRRDKKISKGKLLSNPLFKQRSKTIFRWQTCKNVLDNAVEAVILTRMAMAKQLEDIGQISPLKTKRQRSIFISLLQCRRYSFKQKR